MAGIDFVPQSTDVAGRGADPVAAALAARRKAAISPGQQLTATASSGEPIYSKGLGYAKLLAGALGGYMQGQEADAKVAQTKAGASSAAALARSYGMSPEQAAQWQGLYMTNPTGAMDLLKQHSERALKPDDKSWGVVGKDVLGNERYGFVNTTRGTVSPPGASGAAPAGVAGPSPVQSAPLPPPAGAGGAGAPAPGAQMPPAPDPGPLLGNPAAGGEDARRRAEFTAGGYPAQAPLPPPGVNPKTYFEEWSKSQTAGQLPPKTDDVSGLRREVQSLPSYKNMSQAAPIYKAMFEAAGRNSKSADLNLVYGLGKIMDPGSVVREGEMVMVKNSASLPEWLKGQIDALNGGAQLTPETRKLVMQEAYGRIGAYKQMFDQDAQQYRGIVERGRMNPADVIPDFGQFEPYDPAGPPIPGTLRQDIAAERARMAGQQRQAPAPDPGTPAPAGGGMDLQALEAELLRRQQEMQAQQPQRFTDPMGGTY